ncbi:MAG: cytochrome b N-terminal domain-containing protein [Nitrospinota bacterium]|nr:cytochrome b N-terminal domain-containing protein [Nitrospinota bacterium]
MLNKAMSDPVIEETSHAPGNLYARGKRTSQPGRPHHYDFERNRGFWGWIKPRRLNWRHYFGGAALLLIILQLLSGLYMIFYYEPSLRDTYKTVQYFNNETYLGAFTRNLHRYGAFLLGVAIFVHLWRGYFRKDFQGGRKLNWITGVAMSIVYMGFLISGTILPWEWKGYWMMEMFNNWLKNIPLFGDWMYSFFMESYTPTRNFVIHDIVLPITAFVLLEIHCLTRLRKRGFWDYAARQLVAFLPFVVALVSLSVLFPIPSQDPQQIPLPMEGQFIPAPEWYFVTFLMPYWYYPPRDWGFYLFWIPFVMLVMALALPFIVKRKRKEELARVPAGRRKLKAVAYAGVGATLCGLLLFGFTLGSVKSPWMGCNCCHNASMGDRMGIPPVTYKDTLRNPLVVDNRWMMRHWYEPQVVW